MLRRAPNIKFLRSIGNETCPHCNAILSSAEYLRLDSEKLRCGKGFIPLEKDGPPMRSKLAV